MSGERAARIMTHLVASFPSWEASLEVGKGLVDGGAAYLEVQFPSFLLAPERRGEGAGV